MIGILAAVRAGHLSGSAGDRVVMGAVAGFRERVNLPLVHAISITRLTSRLRPKTGDLPSAVRVWIKRSWNQEPVFR